MYKILVIDDEQMLAEMLKEILEIGGYEADYTTDPKKGMEMLTTTNYDIVCTDVSMGNISGYDIAEFVKNNNLSTKVIFNTGWGNFLSEEELNKYEIAAVIAKPYKLETLLPVIENALSQ